MGRSSYEIYCGYSSHKNIWTFPWKDGTPFDWDKAKSEGKLDEMFLKERAQPVTD